MIDPQTGCAGVTESDSEGTKRSVRVCVIGTTRPELAIFQVLPKITNQW